MAAEPPTPPESAAPASATPEAIDTGANDAEYQAYLQKFKDRKARQAESGSKVERSGGTTTVTTTTPTVPTSAEEAPAASGATPSPEVKVTGAEGSGEGVDAKKTGAGEVEFSFKTAFDIPEPLKYADWQKVKAEQPDLLTEPPEEEAEAEGAPPEAAGAEAPAEAGAATPSAAAPGEPTEEAAAPEGSVAGEKPATAEPPKTPAAGEETATTEPPPLSEGEVPPLAPASPEATPPPGPEEAAPTPPAPSPEATPPTKGTAPADTAPPLVENPAEAQNDLEAKKQKKRRQGEGAPDAGPTPAEQLGRRPAEEPQELVPQEDTGQPKAPSGPPGGRPPTEPEGGTDTTPPTAGAPEAGGGGRPSIRQRLAQQLQSRRKKLSRARDKFEDELSKLEARQNIARTSRHLRVLRFFMPGLYAKISGALSGGKNLAAQPKIIQLQARVLALESAKIALEAGATAGSIIDAAWATIEFIITTSATVILPLLAILLFPVLVLILAIIFLFLGGGTVTSAIKPLIKVVDEQLKFLKAELRKEQRKVMLRKKIHQINTMIAEGGSAEPPTATGENGAATPPTAQPMAPVSQPALPKAA